MGTVGCDAANLLVRRDLVEQVGQHRRIANMASGDLDGPNFPRLFVDSGMDLPPRALSAMGPGTMASPPLWTAMFAGVPLAFALHLDPCTVDQQMERTLRAPVGMFAAKVF